MKAVNDEKKQRDEIDDDDDIGTEITAVSEFTISEKDRRPIIQIPFNCLGEVLWLFILILICPVRTLELQSNQTLTFRM